MSFARAASPLPSASAVRRTLGAALLGGAVALSACGDPATSPGDRLAPVALQARLDSIARAFGVPGAVVAVRRPDGRAYTLTVGVADLASRRAVRAEDRFRIGSITKPMVATVVLQLVDEGRLALDGRLADYLPGVVPGAERMTVRQVLNHTAGIPDYTADDAFGAALVANPGRAWTPAQLLAFVRETAPPFAPGEGFAYSNSDYIVLGLLIERVTGRTVGQELQTRIFDRLGMRATLYSTTAALPAPFAQGYLDLDGAPDTPVGTLVHPSWAGSAGAVVSTAGDVARFVEALAAGTLLTASTRAAQRAPVAGFSYTYPGDAFETRYGLGVQLGGGWVGHDGAIAGYESEAYARTAGTGSIVVLINKTTDAGAPHVLLQAVRAAQFDAAPGS
jgi:D-alanyl-D-alanine carboxypeptidase